MLATMASPAVLFYALPWLMVLLTLGTIMQKELGLYAAQKIYFASWILWFGPLPLPGGYTTCLVITACLLAKFLAYSPWRKYQAGIILTHLSILILMIGGGVTAATQKEGFISIKEGHSGNAVSDYHARVLSITKDGEFFAEIPFEKLQQGQTLETPFTMTVESVCKNCRPVPVKDTKDRHGLAGQIALQNAPEEKENEANLSGVTFSVDGADKGQNGTYAVMEEIPHKANIEFKGEAYSFSLGRAQHVLPFEIELNDFNRDLHPGTDMARGFSSKVTVKDSGVEWPAVISMNEPLRYKGYTFYQASFAVRPDGEYSVLSVVENKGRAFPYISGVLMMAGLMLHIALRMKGRNT